MERNELCWCGSGKKIKKMPYADRRKNFFCIQNAARLFRHGQSSKTAEQIEKIKESARLNTAVLDEVAKHIRIGMSTAEIDDIVYTFTKEHGGIPRAA